MLIGDTFDHTDDPNKAAQLLSHAILGAIIARANGGNEYTKKIMKNKCAKSVQ
jgi:hypothetical protein